MLSQGLVDLPISHWCLGNDLLQLRIDELSHHDLSIVDCHHLPIEFVLPEHAIKNLLASFGLGPDDVVAI